MFMKLTVLILLALLSSSQGFQLTGHEFLQQHRSASSDGQEMEAHEKCAPLKNMQSYFSVVVEVGTPAQKFSVVADTGSDNVIIPSCTCKESGYCNQDAKCFRGTNKSSTFYMSTNGSAAKHGLPLVDMMFGSGAIEAVVGSDMVTVGGVDTMMPDGILLMVQNELQIEDAGGFQGILGLGPPKNETLLALEVKRQQKEVADYQKAAEEQQEKEEKAMAKAMKGRKGEASGDDTVPLDEIVQNKGSDSPVDADPPKEILGRLRHADKASIEKTIARMQALARMALTTTV